MKTDIPAEILATPRGARANEILRSCVHCGFCNATCPTYQVRGNELDGPRGRIYLIKDMLETGTVSDAAKLHLDRCLTCRACETTCPSGVPYGELAEIGREVVAEQRGRGDLMKRLLLWAVPRPSLLRAFVGLARPVRWLAPKPHRRLLRKPPPSAGAESTGLQTEGVSPSQHAARRDPASSALVLQGCVQRVVTPEVNAHLTALLEARGVKTFSLAEEGCCGGLPLHLGETVDALGKASRNVRQLASHEAAAGADAIISTASGCGVTWKEYGRLLGTDDAKAVAARVRDVAEFLEPFEFRKRDDIDRVAWHPPCSLQHGQRISGIVEGILQRAGYRLTQVPDSHLCCGSAGTYSILQPKIAGELKDRKAQALMSGEPDVIATANIGCQTHLDDAVSKPVLHWVELLR